MPRVDGRPGSFATSTTRPAPRRRAPREGDSAPPRPCRPAVRARRRHAQRSRRRAGPGTPRSRRSTGPAPRRDADAGRAAERRASRRDVARRRAVADRRTGPTRSPPGGAAAAGCAGRRRAASRRSSSSATAWRRSSLRTATGRKTRPSSRESSSARRYGVPPRAPRASRSRASSSATVRAGSRGAELSTLTGDERSPLPSMVTVRRARSPALPSMRHIEVDGASERARRHRLARELVELAGAETKDAVLQGHPLPETDPGPVRRVRSGGSTPADTGPAAARNDPTRAGSV